MVTAHTNTAHLPNAIMPVLYKVSTIQVSTIQGVPHRERVKANHLPTSQLTLSNVSRHPRADKGTGPPSKQQRQLPLPGIIKNMHGDSRPNNVTLQYHTMTAKDATLVLHRGIVSFCDQPTHGKRCRERGPSWTPHL